MSTKSLIQQASSIEQAHAIAAERALVTKVVWPAAEIERVYRAAHTAKVQAAAPKPPKSVAHPDTGKRIGSPALLQCALVPTNADLTASTAIVAFQSRQYPRVVRVDVEAGVLGKADHPISTEAFARLQAGKRTSMAFKGEVYLARRLAQ
jgi:hypothetical protein